MVTVRQATSADWPQIARFVAQNYGAQARFKHQERWHWQLMQAPGIADADAHPTSWLAHDGGEIVGQISLQPTQLHLPGRRIDGGWICDVMVAPSHRGHGIGHQIYAAILDAGHTAFTLTMAEATRRIAMKAGAMPLPPVAQLLKVNGLRPGTLKSAIARSAAAGGKGAMVPAPFWPVMARIGAATANALVGRSPLIPIGEGMEVRALESLDPGLIGQLEGAAYFDRSPQFFDWRFTKSSDLQYQQAVLIRDGKPAGLIVWRLPHPAELKVGTICEVLADPDDRAIHRALIQFASEQMSECEAVVAGTSLQSLQASFMSAGFRQVKTHRPLVSSRDKAVLEAIRSFKGPWHMSKADHDWDQIHPVE